MRLLFVKVCVRFTLRLLSKRPHTGRESMPPKHSLRSPTDIDPDLECSSLPPCPEDEAEAQVDDDHLPCLEYGDVVGEAATVCDGADYEPAEPAEIELRGNFELLDDELFNADSAESREVFDSFRKRVALKAQLVGLKPLFTNVPALTVEDFVSHELDGHAHVPIAAQCSSTAQTL